MSAEQETLLEILGLILAFALAVRLGWVVFVAFRSGVVRITRTIGVSRETKPTTFWAIVGLQIGLVVLLLAVSARHLVRLA